MTAAPSRRLDRVKDDWQHLLLNRQQRLKVQLLCESLVQNVTHVCVVLCLCFGAHDTHAPANMMIWIFFTLLGSTAGMNIVVERSAMFCVFEQFLTGDHIGLHFEVVGGDPKVITASIESPSRPLWRGEEVRFFFFACC